MGTNFHTAGITDSEALCSSSSEGEGSSIEKIILEGSGFMEGNVGISDQSKHKTHKKLFVDGFKERAPRKKILHDILFTPVTGDCSRNMDYGQLNFSDYVDQFLVNSAVGQVVKEYSYDVKNGLLTFPKHHVTNNNGYRGNELDVMAGFGLIGKPCKQRDENSIYVTLLGPGKEKCISEDTNKIESSDVLSDNYLENNFARTLEKPVVYNPRNPTDNSSRFAQPQLHVGILAIPQLSPTTNDENFQLSTVYWEVEYELDVVVNYHSYYTFGNLSMGSDMYLNLMTFYKEKEWNEHKLSELNKKLETNNKTKRNLMTL